MAAQVSESVTYIAFDDEGREVSKGHIGQEPNIPTHGSISILVQGQWINIRTSEWMVIEIGEKPVTWKEHDEKIRKKLWP